MAERGVRVEHPDRRTAASRTTRAIVVSLLLASAALVAVISVGGWDAIQGAKAVQVGFVVVYVVLAALVLRWNRGVLPLPAALAIVLLIFAAVSAPAWFDRDRPGLADPALDESVLGLLSVLLVPLQLLLIAFAMSGFRQAWHVEVEHREEPPATRAQRGSSPAPA